MITTKILKGICPHGSTSNIDKYVVHLNASMPKYGINTLQRIRHFIAQLAHESASFNYSKEIASGAAYDTGALAKRLGNTPEPDGDGQKYKGRGLIQITGRSNYERCSVALFGDKRLADKPELLEQPEWAVKSACWFWQDNGLNMLADADDIKAITRRINGGYNGLQDRVDFYTQTKKYII